MFDEGGVGKFGILCDGEGERKNVDATSHYYERQEKGLTKVEPSSLPHILGLALSFTSRRSDGIGFILAVRAHALPFFFDSTCFPRPTPVQSEVWVKQHVHVQFIRLAHITIPSYRPLFIMHWANIGDFIFFHLILPSTTAMVWSPIAVATTNDTPPTDYTSIS